jgi:hypothetical protein
MIEQIGNDFYNLMQDADMAEEVVVTSPSGTQYALKLSAVPNTKSSYMQAEREYMFYGVMTFPDAATAIALRGSYFVRSRFPTRKYMLVSVIPEPTNAKIASVFAMEATELVDIARLVETVNTTTGNTEITATVVQADVSAYVTETLQRQQQTADGNTDKTICTVRFPARYTLSTSNVILRYGFEMNPATGLNVLKKIRYRVDSIDTSMMHIGAGGVVTGTIGCQLSVDLRAQAVI